MRVLAWANAKGGSGRTSACINTATALAKDGLRVLIVDLDPQANASLVLLGDGGVGEGATVGDVLLGEADALDAIYPTKTAGLDVMPSNVQLADVAVSLTNAIGREARLRTALADLKYDLCMIDNGPTFNVLVVNSLVAADAVLVALEPSLFGMAGPGQLGR